MNKIQKTKQHIIDNKAIYITGGVCLVVGALGGGLYAIKNDALVNTKAIQVLTWKSKQTIEVYVEALGDPGNIIQDTTTGIIYASQGQAAKELGVTPAAISQHLAGKTSHVKGHAFVKLAKAMVPPLESTA